METEVKTKKNHFDRCRGMLANIEKAEELYQKQRKPLDDRMSRIINTQIARHEYSRDKFLGYLRNRVSNLERKIFNEVRASSFQWDRFYLNKFTERLRVYFELAPEHQDMVMLEKTMQEIESITKQVENYKEIRRIKIGRLMIDARRFCKITQEGFGLLYGFPWNHIHSLENNILTNGWSEEWINMYQDACSKRPQYNFLMNDEN